MRNQERVPRLCAIAGIMTDVRMFVEFLDNMKVLALFSRLYKLTHFDLRR